MKSIIKHIFYPLILKRDGLGGLSAELRRLEKSQFSSPEQIREIQLKRLRALLSHAYNNTSFYRKRLDECGFDPGTVRTIEDLKKIPPLTKDDILSHLKSMIAENYTADQFHYSTSGGTTGIVTEFALDNASLPVKRAAMLRFDKWTGWEFGEWMSLIWPATMDTHDNKTLRGQIKNYLSYRQIKLALTVIDERHIENHLTSMLKQKATMIRGFPTPLHETAKYIKEYHPKKFYLKGIVTTGEMLYPHQREVIEEAFHCKVFDSYRTRELGPLAQECEAHQGMHINAESVIIETVPFSEDKENGFLQKGEGRILVTDLVNFGMPFIRYEIGDIGMLSEKKCSCGRGLPMLENVGGRLVDMVYSTSGKPIASITLIPNLVSMLGLFKRVQFVQDALDHIIIRIENPCPPESILNRQIENAKIIFGPNLRVDHEFVDSIPSGKSGKYQFVICKLPEKDNTRISRYERESL